MFQHSRATWPGKTSQHIMSRCKTRRREQQQFKVQMTRTRVFSGAHKEVLLSVINPACRIVQPQFQAVVSRLFFVVIRSLWCKNGPSSNLSHPELRARNATRQNQRSNIQRIVQSVPTQWSNISAREALGEQLRYENHPYGSLSRGYFHVEQVTIF